jgi:hypothetical protein
MKKENVFSDTSESNMFDGCFEIKEIRIDKISSRKKTLQNANQIVIDCRIKMCIALTSYQRFDLFFI